MDLRRCFIIQQFLGKLNPKLLLMKNTGLGLHPPDDPSTNQMKLLLLAVISIILQPCEAQSTYNYSAVPTQQLLNDLPFDMGAVGVQNNMTGFELNFWAQPFYTQPKQETIINVCGAIDIQFKFQNSDNTIGFGLAVGDKTGYDTLPTQSNALWINVNLRVMYNKYILLNAWQGNNWYELDPSLKVYIATPNSSLYSNNTSLTIKKTSSTLGAYVGDFRIEKLSETDSYAQFLRHYEVPFNARWPNTINYFFIRDTIFTLQPSMANQNDVSSYSLKKIDVLRCNTSMAMQADGNCSMNCLTSKCLFCQTIDKQFYNICRFCDGVSSSCQPISKCPTDYYSEFGICYKCPIGCSSCTREDLCTSCDAGLILNQVKNLTTEVDANGLASEVTIILNATCDCPIGQFGTFFPALDQANCSKCDETCRTCADTNVKCTSCSAPLFWIGIDGGMCVSSCSNMNDTYFGDLTDRVCKLCASNCKKCTSLTGCTDCHDYNQTVTVLLQKNDSQGVGEVDVNGQPILIPVNQTLSKRLLNAEGICLISCPANSINNSTFFMCHMCPTECLTCNQISRNCTSCNITLGSLFTFQNATLAKQEGRCYSKCPQGYFSDQNVCKMCDTSCTVCEQLNFCTNCTMDYVNNKLYHFVNYQCKLDCGERYYPDHSDPTFYFCRSCPSNCLNCNSARLCTACINDYYLTTLNGYQLCVLAKDCADGSYADAASGQCKTCIPNCKVCGGNTGCSECFDGFFLNNNVCINRCPTAKFALPSGACQNCIANCDECKDTLSCKTCTTGYMLLEDTSQCVSGVVCPTGYFLGVQNNCTLCKPECQKCTSLSVCTGCILGHTLKGTNCENNCGNGLRQDIEYCDDGNDQNGDGCRTDCTVEDGFVCEQGVLAIGATSAPDICRCDPLLNIAEWIDYWGTLRLKFDTEIYYNSSSSPKSDIPLTFCQQFLTPSTIQRLGTSYGCFLQIATGSSELIVDVGKDATIGNRGENYDTYITLIEGAILVKGCISTGIPVGYSIKNLPLDTPQTLFTSSIGSFQIGQCANEITLNLATSKGLTKRDFDTTWTLISLTPADDNLKELLQQNLDNTFKGGSFYTIGESYIEMLKGKTISLQSRITNFLARDSKNTTLLQFTKTKKIEIIDIPDSITFQTSLSNQLFPRFRLPYCLADSMDNMAADYAQISYKCQMYDVALTTKRWPLTNCTVPANNMSLSTQYIVQVMADYAGDATYSTVKNVFVQPSSPPVQVALIQGCNRVFSPNNSFTLEAIYNTNVNTTTFVWQCNDKATGSVCFSTGYQYITLGNSAKITVSKDIFFYNMQYEFIVTAFDSDSDTNSSISCMMYSSGPKDKIMDVIIEGEATKTGFIDFTRQQTAFKAFITNIQSVTRANLKYTWQMYDSSGKVMKDSEVLIYQNSIGVSTDLMNRNSLYSVVVKATDGVNWGNATQILRTKPDISNEFEVEPSDLDPRALTTKFSLTVFSQKTFDSLDQYVFGYIDPANGITKIPMTQRSYKKFVTFILPEPTSGTSLTCYVDVIMPNRVSMTYYKTVSISPTDLTVAAFMDDVSKAVMDDLVESMQLKHKLVSLRTKMTVAQKSTVINRMLEGLVKETTPLSDYYIQSSVGSLLEYVSKETDSLLSNAQIVTTSAKIFQQMTIGENSGLDNGRSIKFGKAVTQSLFNFANNLFSKDFTNLIGGQEQLAMKVMFMNGLKNILKGSLSNMILGDAGGFSYQGQNIYAKATKFDTLENQFRVNCSLPKSISGNMTQNFVNISLPGANSPSNPCKGYAACQVSVIILDQPITRFISNSKDSTLKSMLVEISISSTEVSSPDPWIQIMELPVKNLVDPIKITVPLYSVLNTSNPNNTLSCGFIDPQDQIFKQTGVGIELIAGQLVTCLASHLTQIAIEEYAQDVKTASSTTEDTKTSAAANVLDEQTMEIVNMWDSWAIYASFFLPGILLIGLLWARRKDARDLEILPLIIKSQKKIYVNLYLEPIPEVRKEPVMKAKKKNQNIEDEDYGGQHTTMKIDPNKDFFSPDNNTAVKGLMEPNATATMFGVADANIDGMSMGSKKKKIKKKKKKFNNEVMDPVAQDMFFEGGQDQSSDEYFEGGDEDDFFAVADAEESARMSGKKKKKKKKASNLPKSVTVMEPDELPPLAMGRRGGAGPVHEILDEDNDHHDDKRSSRGKSKTMRPGSSKSRERLNETKNLDDSRAHIHHDDGKSDRSKSPSKKGGNKKRKQKTLRRQGSHASQATMGDEGDEADYAAEEMVSPKKKKSLKKKKTQVSKAKNNNDDVVQQLQYNVQEENGAMSARAEQRLMDEAGIEHDTQGNLQQRMDTQSKGFETLMNEELEKAKAQMKGAKKHKEKKKAKEERKKKGYFEKEAATCIQFCIWNCKEGHRCSSLFKYYNQYLSRSSRIVLLIMSWFMFIMVTGYLVDGNQIMAPKAVKTEQFAMGTLAALITRIWVVAVTGFLMHSKREKVYQEIFDADDAKFKVGVNMCRYYFGLVLVMITVIVSYVNVFKFSAYFTQTMAVQWGWATLFAVISDLIVVDGAFIALATLLTMTVGAAPDACGKSRNCWLNCVPQAIKDAAE